jgi:SWI/SNF-related matrix-associated actin-dependent regulator 1 of chromatin subfamily A
MERAMQDEAFLKSVKKLPKKEREFAIAEYRSEVEYKSARAEILQKIELCKQVAALGKLEQMKEWIDSFLESDEKLVLFCNHKMVINELAEAFPKIHMKIVGGQDALASDKDKSKFDLDDRATIRDAAVARFQKDPKCTLGLCSIGAGGVGHTLTAANNVGLFELPWGPADCDQAEDRCHRIGQKDNVTCWYFVAEDTIEERILELIESKRMVLNAVHDGNPLHGMNDGSVMIDLIKILTRGKIVLL